MVFNNADNIMYGEKEVDRVFYGKNLVWERGYKWINDVNNNIIGYRNKKRPYGNIYLNWCEKPYTVTKPYEGYTLSPIKGYNIFGDKIEKTNSVWLDEEYQIVERNKPSDFFDEVDLIINNNICVKISDFSFALRQLSSITFPTHGVSTMDGGYELSYIGDYAFYKTKVKNPNHLNFDADVNLPSAYYPSVLYIGQKIGKMAFAFSNVITGLSIGCLHSQRSVTIDEKAFYGCNSITSLQCFNTNLTNGDASFIKGNIEIKESAFENCGNLSELVCCGSDVKVSSLAFSFCRSLNNIVYFKVANCTIETNAFKRSSLSELNLDATNITIKKDAFNQCENLKVIRFYKSYGLRINLEQDAFRDQVAYNCKFVIEDNNTKTALINSGVPESLIINNNE